MEYKLKIGLEIHIELKTEHKLFCNCKNLFGQKINSLCCSVCLGKENALPRFNKEVIFPALKAAKALNCKINSVSSFDRKHYSYPDLPKGYQITQRFKPIAENGYLLINDNKVRIAEMHIEEDAGKIIYDENGNFTVDHNRCGVPLIEIVTMPDITNAKEAVDFLKTLRLKLLYAGVSDCKMQEGSMRCDVNISVEKLGNDTEGERIEIKNASSFKFIEKAINYEFERQKALLEQGLKIERMTMRIDESTGKTIPMRKKESAEDYRYSPDTDLDSLILTEDDLRDIEAYSFTDPEILLKKYTDEIKMIKKNAVDLINKPEFCLLFENTIPLTLSPLTASNLIISELFRDNEVSLSEFQLAELSDLLYEEKISSQTAKKVIGIIKNTNSSPKEVIESQNLYQINNSDKIREFVLTAIKNNPEACEDFRKGKKSSIGPILGEISRMGKGLVNLKIATDILEKELI